MKRNKFIKRISGILVVLFLFLGTTFVNAGFWEQASDWYSAGSTSTYLDSSIITEIANMIEVIGTAVIAITTVVLGIKYMVGSVTEKAEVKENMITLLVACIFFFGWSNLRQILIKGVTYDQNGVVSGISGSSQLFIFNGNGTLEGAFAQVFSIVLIIAKLVAIVATVYMGVKYIFSGAEGKAKLKEKGIMYIVGIILIFTTLNILTFISNSINNALS